MACGGLTQCELSSDPAKKQGNFTLRLLKVAFEMRKFVQPLSYNREGHNIQLKIGIHYGPVIAGVIGHHKPQFSLIGDTVNTTSRLCSTGRDGKIILSEKAYSKVRDLDYLSFFDRRVDAKGKGELLTYEVKLIKNSNRKPYLKRNNLRSPLEDIKQSLDKYKKTMINKNKEHSKPKQRMFDEILKSESPSEIHITKPNPLSLKKSLSDICSQLNLTKIINQKESYSQFSFLKSPSYQEREISNKQIKNLRLSLPKEKETKNKYYTPTYKPMISPLGNKTPEARSPTVDLLGFSSFFPKEISFRSYQDIDSSELKQKGKPECIKEEEEASDHSPEKIFVDLTESINKFDEGGFLLEEFDYEESLPGEFFPKPHKSNYSFESLEENEDMESQSPGSKNLREYLQTSKNQGLLTFSQVSLRFFNGNEEELLNEFDETLYRNYLEDFRQKKVNSFKILLVLMGVVYIGEFLVIILKGVEKQELLIRLGLLIGLGILNGVQKRLFKAKYAKKSIWGLFIVLGLLKNAYSEDLFKELGLAFIILGFSEISFMTFSDSCLFIVLQIVFYIIFEPLFSPAILLFLLLSIGLILFMSYQNYLSRLNRFNYSLINKQKKTEQKNLLMHLLPNHIFKKFMLNPSKSELINEFEDVTLLFADIKGFTEFSSKRSPSEVVNMLRDLFTEFDKLCLKNNVYKLYTIGDCYVVLGMVDGDKRGSIEEEARNIILMAFSMIDTIRLVRKKINYNGLDMRIGIHTGKIIGGIIGTDIVRYDIYGKDVLIANKMEANGKEGHIMVSSATKNLLEISFRNVFLFEYYKEVNIPALKTNIAGYFVYPNNMVF